MSSTIEQIDVCDRYDVKPEIPVDKDNIGIALDTLDQNPINGLRHQPEADTCGWYIWGGIEFPNGDDAFSPLHVEHLKDYCPAAIEFLGLPVGWRFLTDGERSDAWEDESLVQPFELAPPGRVQRLVWGIAILVVGLPILGLAIWALTNPADKSFSISIWATLLVVALLGGLLSATGLRLVFDKPRKDGSLLHPAILRFVGVVFVALASFLAYAVDWSAPFTTVLKELLLPAVFCFSIAGMCFFSAQRRTQNSEKVEH